MMVDSPIRQVRRKSNTREKNVSLAALSLGLCLLITLLLVTSQVNALDLGEIIALKDTQAEWGTQLGWTGSPSCTLSGVSEDESKCYRFLFSFSFS